MPPRKRSHPYKRRSGMTPRKIIPTPPSIDLRESPPSIFPTLGTAELVKISPLETDVSHETSISRVLNPNFVASSAPRTTSIFPRALPSTLNPSFSQPPRISTRVFTTVGLFTDNIPTVLYSHPWSSNSNFPSFTSPANPCRCSLLPNTFPVPSTFPQPSSFGLAWINPYEPRPSLGSFNYCYQMDYTSNNPRIECAGFVNRYLFYPFLLN